MMFSSQQLPRAMVKTVNPLNSVWLIPLIALLIGVWMIVDTWKKQGPEITIHFTTAEGIVVNKTLIKFREIAIGKVTQIALNEQLSGVVVTARIDGRYKSLLTEKSQFWVVKPRIGLGDVSGLSTLISGAYIEFSPSDTATLAYQFEGLASPPLTPSGTPGLHVTLDSNSDHAFQIGDPVLFRGNKAGRVEYVYFNSQERKTYYDVFIDAPYDQLITTNTRFWEVKGIEVDLSAAGIKVNTGTLQTLISGGVAFDVPTYLSKGDRVTERAFFSIYPNKEKVNERIYRVGLNYMLLFHQDIRGLKPGSPVEFQGIKVGEVVRTDIDYPEINDFMSRRTLLPVMIKIEPGRVGLNDSESGKDKLQRQLTQWIREGLHAVLATDNYLTGAKYIALNYQNIMSVQYTESQDIPIDTFGDLQVIPTADGEFQQLWHRINNVVDNIAQWPVNEVLVEAKTSLSAMKQAMVSFEQASSDMSQLLQDQQSRALIAQANASLKAIEKLANSYQQGSTSEQQLTQLLKALNQTVTTLHPLLLKLTLKPNSLIFSGSQHDEAQPTATTQH
jgi:paraquat-inducible protein B